MIWTVSVRAVAAYVRRTSFGAFAAAREGKPSCRKVASKNPLAESQKSLRLV